MLSKDVVNTVKDGKNLTLEQELELVEAAWAGLLDIWRLDHTEAEVKDMLDKHFNQPWEIVVEYDPELNQVQLFIEFPKEEAQA